MSDHQQKLIPLHVLAEMTRGHSIFSPSGSFLWAFCHGGLIPNLLVDDDGAGIEAATGTVGHTVGETWLESGIRPTHLLGTVVTVVEGKFPNEQVFEITIDEEMLDYIERYFDWCYYLPGEHFVEVRVDFSDLTPIKNQGGTADHAACEPGKLTITDLKYGIGIRVFAFHNTQALLYAYGFFMMHDWYYDFQIIVIRICQPRLDHFDEWEITREDLLDWAAWLKEQAFKAWRYGAPRTPSEKACQWCKIKSDCKAYLVWVDRLTRDVFQDLDAEITEREMSDLVADLDKGTYVVKTPRIQELTYAHKAHIYKYRNLLKSWMDELGKDLYRGLERGEDVPDWKLVDGNKSRSFKNEKKAKEELDFLGLSEDVIEPKSFISPAQAETELVKIGYKRRDLPELMKPLIKERKGKPTMVPKTSNRKSFAELSDDIFADLDDLDEL